jgi:signal transduction histidine kinase
MIVEGDTIIGSRNIDSLRTSNPRYMYRQLDKMKKKNPPIPIVLEGGYTQYLYYLNSTLLRRLTWYPYIQLGIILLFILVSYLAFSASRKAEQNQVWVGLSKETAHQLGTPTSAMLGWVEILREKHLDEELVSELGKDADRLERITERFSKIGSRPVLKPESIMEVVSESVEYLRSRTSELVVFELDRKQTDYIVPLNKALFGWVIENVCKNAVDAIEGNGRIHIGLNAQEKMVHLDIRDSGKGIPKKYHKTIFKPGYTTKQRGWGLGLSLAKRIIESYHQGKIHILQSDPGKGTTMRISLKK